MPANTLNPTILSALVQQVAEKAISPASILSVVQANSPIHLGDWHVSFIKNKPGDFTVNTYQGDDGQPLTTIHAGSPVEAKLLLIEQAVDHWNQAHRQ